MLERLQKILSARGICSRRKAEEYILGGLVKVNGKIAKLGQKADAVVDQIEVDGKVLKDRQEMLYFVMNKPVGVETTNVENISYLRGVDAMSAPRVAVGVRGKQSVQRSPAFEDAAVSPDSPSVRDLLPPHLQGKVFPVGRLDKESSGLLLFTNDGVLAFHLTHPKFHHEKEYEVELDRAISPIDCRKLEEGFEMDGSQTKPLKVQKIRNNTLRILLTEGKNRQIRRMCQYVGYTVKELRRVRVVTLVDKILPEGAIRALTKEEKTRLLEAVSVQ